MTTNTMNKADKEQAIILRDEARQYLRQTLPPGTTVYAIMRHVSASGMFRRFSLIVPWYDKDNSTTIRDITYNAAQAMEYKTDKNGDIGVSGCGMDMAFRLVYSLGEAIFGRGEKCAALGYVSGRNGSTEPETDGGYMLKKHSL